MLIETLSTFPHMYDSVMNESMMKRAQEKGILQFHAYDLRDWTHDRHRTTDDDPYGGGAGLVMKCEPIFEAVEDIAGCEVGPHFADDRLGAGFSEHSNSLKQSCFGGTVHRTVPRRAELARLEHSEKPATEVFNVEGCERLSASEAFDSGESQSQLPPSAIVFLAPQGRVFDDAFAGELAAEKRLLFVCGHYEGIDERAYTLADYVISLGDYVLTSGELASMVVIDAVVRKLPGVLGAADGPLDESFANGLLEYPQYTRPAEYRGMKVPEVLLSGDHGKVAQWRLQQSLERTQLLRPDLYEAYCENAN